jgi:teichuronic acid biosynthesis glycosyltransferase TuaG
MPEKISIITALYNTERFIGQAIESIFAQSYQDWEMIIVDDCSTDSSVSIVKTLAKEDTRIKLIRLNENFGPTVARNTAIDASTGRYIAFLDSDDLWKTHKLEKQVEFMGANNYAMTYTWYDKVDEAGNPLGKRANLPSKLSYEDMLKSNYIGCLTAMYDAKKLGKVYMPQIRKRQDYGLWLKILRQEKFAYCLPEVLATYRVRIASVSSNKWDLIKYHWQLFRNVEKLSALKSTRCLCWNIVKRFLDELH